MRELEQSLARMRGAWLAGGPAAAHCPEEWKPVVGDAADAELRLAALTGQAMQVAFRPLAGAQIELRAPVPRLALPTVAEAQRPRVRRLLAAFKQSHRYARSMLVLMAQRGFTTHPADWMPSASDSTAPDVYAPWTDWAAKFSAQSEQQEISAETWSDWPPAARRTALGQLRQRDPDAAREIIAKCAGAEPAEKRIELVALLSHRLSDNDVGYLESLAADRSDKVKAVARNLLARLGRGETQTDLVAELAAFMTVGKTGLLNRKTVVSFFPKLQNAAQKNRRYELFGLVTYPALAKQLGLSEDELANMVSLDDPEAAYGLATMLAETASEATIRTVVKRLLEDAKQSTGLVAMLAQRLSSDDRLAMAPRVAAEDRSDFATTLEFLGDGLGALPLETFSNLPAYRDFSVSLAAWAAGGENTDAAERNSKMALTHLGFLLDAPSAARLLAQATAVGLSPSEPALDILHLNAALKPEPKS